MSEANNKGVSLPVPIFREPVPHFCGKRSE